MNWEIRNFSARKVEIAISSTLSMRELEPTQKIDLEINES